MKLCLIVMLCFVAVTCLCQSSNSNRIDFIKEVEMRTNFKIDSITTSFHQQLDTLKVIYGKRIQDLDATNRELMVKISERGQIYSDRIQFAADSVTRLARQLEQRLTNKLDSAKERVKQNLGALTYTPALKQKVGEFTDGMNKIGVKQIAFPSETHISALNSYYSSELSLTDRTNILEKIRSKVPTDQIEVYQPKIEQAKHLKNLSVEDASQLAETEISKAADIPTMSNVVEGSEEYKKALTLIKDPLTGRYDATQAIKQKAYDHFSDKSEILETGMGKMDKYKNKFSSLSSIKERPRRIPNAMKGKPVLERLVPSVSFQVLKKSDLLMADVYSSLAFRVTGKLNIGAGWNHRFGFDKNSKSFDSSIRIFGPRIFTEFDLWRSFFPRVEFESMNTFVPPFGQNMDAGHREWVTDVSIGIKKSYSIHRNIKGSAMVMTMPFRDAQRSPYESKINVRVGIDVSLTKKKNKQTSPRT